MTWQEVWELRAALEKYNRGVEKARNAYRNDHQRGDTTDCRRGCGRTTTASTGICRPCRTSERTTTTSDPEDTT